MAARQRRPPLPLLLVISLAAAAAVSSAAKAGAGAGAEPQPAPRPCDFSQPSAAEPLRRCLQTNAELLFPTFNQSAVLLAHLGAVTALINAEMRRRQLDTVVPAPTAASLGGMRLQLASVRPFRLTVAYPRLAGAPRRRRAGGGADHSVTSSNHETSVGLRGEVAAANGTAAFARLSIATVRFIINDFIAAEGGGEETVSMSKTTVSEDMGLRLDDKFLKFASLILEIFADPVSGS